LPYYHVVTHLNLDICADVSCVRIQKTKPKRHTRTGTETSNRKRNLPLNPRPILSGIFVQWGGKLHIEKARYKNKSIQHPNYGHRGTNYISSVYYYEERPTDLRTIVFAASLIDLT
jgi:hypothetical protein